MFEVNSWLVIASISILSLQGAQLRRFTSNLAVPVAIIVSIVLALILSEFVSTQSLPVWQNLAASQLHSLQIILLLEASLACFGNLKFLPIGTLIAFCFGQLYFFQQGLVDLSFTLQGILYAAIVAVIFMANHLLSRTEKYWANTLFIVLAISTFLTISASATISSNNVHTTFSWTDMWICVASIAVLLTLGVLKPKALSKLNQFRTKK